MIEVIGDFIFTRPHSSHDSRLQRAKLASDARRAMPDLLALHERAALGWTMPVQRSRAEAACHCDSIDRSTLPIALCAIRLNWASPRHSVVSADCDEGMPNFVH